MSNDLERFLVHARGSAAAGGAKLLSLDELRARRGAEPAADTSWGLAALRGRLVELSARGATATLTAAFELVTEAQTQGEPVAWFTLATSTFYPPDVADCGVDLSALVVVRASDAIALARSAERCLRSGAFGLVIIDLGSHVTHVSHEASAPTSSPALSPASPPSYGARASQTARAANDGAVHVAMTRPRNARAQPPSTADLSMSIQGRLVTLAQTHDAAVVCLTDKTEDTASLGSLVSLRAEALRMHEREHADFDVSVRVLKDKRRGPGFTKLLKRRGPAGLI